ncbi:MAG: hypothetical protein HBSAPP04_22530 [Ignavibacteriaceae bacterium]|nr:MAG: hypothetical protein HBSAPP04_22530 [Ignavibacteriaceae bacterium]
MSDYTVRYRIGVDTGSSAENLDKVAKAGERTDQKLKQVTNTTAGGSGSATYALTNFNRVVQDAPFGLMGVANNIDPFVQSFQKLKAETGSASGAFKALAGTLSGPTGVLFGVSLAVTALQVLPGLLSKTAGAAQQLNKEMAQVGISAKGEEKQIRALSSSLLNNNYSMEQRKSTLKEIQKINPEYLKDIKIEKMSFDELRVKINEANKALAIKTELTIGYAQIAALSKKAAELEVQMTSEMPDFQDWLVSYIKNGIFGNGAAVMTGASGEFVTRNMAVLEKIEARIKAITDRMSKLSYSGFTGGGYTTPDVNPSANNDPKKKAKQAADLLLEMIMQALLENRARMDETLAERAARPKDYRNLPAFLDPTWKGRSGGDNSLMNYNPLTDPIDSSITAEVRVIKMDNAYKKLFQTLTKMLDLSKNLKQSFDSAGEAVANEVGDSVSVFKEANSLLEIFINSLARAAAQAISLSIIRSAFSFLGGGIPFLSFLSPSAGGAASGGGSMGFYDRAYYGSKDLVANRKLTLELAPVEFRQSGYDLKAVVSAVDKKIASER